MNENSSGVRLRVVRGAFRRHAAGIVPVVVLSLACLFVSPARADDFIAGYHLGAHVLLLDESLRGEDGALKPFKDLTASEIATLYHELWHAWFIEVDAKRNGRVYRQFAGKVNALYPDHPEDRRLEIHEEAVADFLDAVIETYVSVYRFLDGKSPEQRRAVLEETTFVKGTYGTVFHDKYTGYYTKSVPAAIQSIQDPSTSATLPSESAQPPEIEDARKVLGAFLRDAREAGMPVHYVEEACQAIKGVAFIEIVPRRPSRSDLQSQTRERPQADVVFAIPALDADDMAIVVRELLENKLTEDWRGVFAEERFAPGDPSGSPRK